MGTERRLSSSAGPAFPPTQAVDSGRAAAVASPLVKCYLPDSRQSEAMGLALAEAEKALALGEVPVGAVAWHDGRVICGAHNLREVRADPLAHAELLAISEAARRLGRWRLEDVALVVTLEPCVMCMGAILQSRIPLLVYGASDPKAGAAGSLYDLSDDPRLNHRVEVRRGVRQEESSKILRAFFDERRSPGGTG